MPSSHSFLISNHMLLWLLTLVVGCIDFKGWIVKAIEEMLSIHKWNLIKSLDGATKSAYYCCLLREGVRNKTLGRSLPNLTHPRWGGFWEVWTLFGNQPPHPPTLAASDFPSRWEIPFPCCSVKTEEGVRVVSCLLSTHPYRHDGRLLAPQAVDLWRLVDDLEYLKSVSSQT